MQLKNDLLLRAARGEAVERTPVWLMRQAGRILPEYRAVRESLSGFKELVETPELAAEVTIQPVDLLDVDAAIIFSDILVVPEAMGCTYEMIEKRGPIFPNTIRTEADLKRLRVADPHEHLHYVLDAIKVTKKALNGRVPLIGFAGAPWTILAYMVEGSGSKTFSVARGMLYTNPRMAHQLLRMITDTTIAYLQAQVEAGANLIQVFDSWAGILSPALYREFALPYISEICNAIRNVPVTVFAKGAFFAMEDFSKLNCETIGLDWNTDINWARQQVGPNKTLQGNMDPCLLYSSFDNIERETIKMLKEFGPERHIANLGHGVYPDTDPEKVKCFIQTVKAYGGTINS
ncbi:uroporphyrinogen decarboxylase [Pontibacter akesuensis]|uniref:Uroporphyrinogen decarboxylase n=1 Tax=Pontibacter akesuensis TaxID=388950 RepID=A0A1I7H6Y2_9BACT|nr:uroporphyrinogen decarboxylase [Pontibacter akesuensis]GHA53008.1 uroporphyrinogen decarboxylase [Pontibacter akesuensis]SFU56435.1 uroporphyrinogen decarboxylase [Pontibacter akesuensis]